MENREYEIGKKKKTHEFTWKTYKKITCRGEENPLYQKIGTKNERYEWLLHKLEYPFATTIDHPKIS